MRLAYKDLVEDRGDAILIKIKGDMVIKSKKAVMRFKIL